MQVGHVQDLEMLLIEEEPIQEEEFELQEEVVPVPVEDNLQVGHDHDLLLIEELDQEEELELEEAL